MNSEEQQLSDWLLAVISRLPYMYFLLPFSDIRHNSDQGVNSSQISSHLSHQVNGGLRLSMTEFTQDRRI